MKNIFEDLQIGTIVKYKRLSDTSLWEVTALTKYVATLTTIQCNVYTKGCERVCLDSEINDGGYEVTDASTLQELSPTAVYVHKAEKVIKIATFDDIQVDDEVCLPGDDTPAYFVNCKNLNDLVLMPVGVGGKITHDREEFNLMCYQVINSTKPHKPAKELSARAKADSYWKEFYGK